MEHCNKIINKYKYANLIKNYPLENVGILRRIHVKLLTNKQLALFICWGTFLKRIQIMKHSVKYIMKDMLY